MSIREIQEEKEPVESHRICGPGSKSERRVPIWELFGYDSPEPYMRQIRAIMRRNRMREPLFQSNAPGGHKKILDSNCHGT